MSLPPRGPVRGASHGALKPDPKKDSIDMRFIKLECVYDKATGRDRWIAWCGDVLLTEAPTRSEALANVRSGK